MSFKAMRGNKYIELLSTNNKILMNQWKMHSSVKKEYDSLSKTYVYNVGGKSPMAQMCLPKDKKQKLNLYFPLLVLQLHFPVKANLLCDIGVTSCNSQRKRITLSSNQKSKQNSSLFTVLPFTIENSDKWINVLVDIEEIVSTMWNNLKLKEIDFLSLSGVFRLKRVFLLSRDLINFTEGVFVGVLYDQLPKQMSLPKNIVQHYAYVSSSCNSPEECVKAKDGDIAETNSRSSSRTTLDNERVGIREIKALALSNRSKNLVSNFLTNKPLSPENHKMFGETFDLNLSMLTFSDKTEPKSLTEFNNLPLQINMQPRSCQNLNVSTKNTEQNIELWMPLCSINNKNDSLIN